MQRIAIFTVFAILVGAGIGGAMVAGWALWGVQSSCVPSHQIQQFDAWTPSGIANSPYPTGTVTFTIHAGTSSARNGSVAVVYDRVQYSDIYR